MKKNRGNPSRKKALIERARESDGFSNYWSDHITGKHICLKCNTVQSHQFKCCNIESYSLGKYPRTPKKRASRSKWKEFYKYIIHSKPMFKQQDEYINVLNKYNITKDIT